MITPFLNPADMVDTGAQIAALVARYDWLRPVPVVAEVWSPAPARLTELLNLDRPLTAAEWVEITAFERASA
jgi:hypothetical protein